VYQILQDMTEKIVYIGKKPLHVYIKAVAIAFEEDEKSVIIIARGATISRAVDLAREH